MNLGYCQTHHKNCPHNWPSFHKYWIDRSGCSWKGIQIMIATNFLSIVWQKKHVLYCMLLKNVQGKRCSMTLTNKCLDGFWHVKICLWYLQFINTSVIFMIMLYFIMGAWCRTAKGKFYLIMFTSVSWFPLSFFKLIVLINHS